MLTEFTTIEFIESAGAPIFFTFEFLGLFVPATTKIISFSNWILSKIAASGDIKLEFISITEPKDKFQTFISLFFSTISFIVFKTINELKLPLFATPKCLTLNLPQPSSKFGFIVAPSTMIDETSVPW